MVIDCGSCQMRELACGDCVVSVLLGPPGQQGHHVNADEQQALGVLADSGLVPPLRLVVNNGLPTQRHPSREKTRVA